MLYTSRSDLVYKVDLSSTVIDVGVLGTCEVVTTFRRFNFIDFMISSLSLARYFFWQLTFVCTFCVTSTGLQSSA